MSRTTQEQKQKSCCNVAYRTITFSGRAFQRILLSQQLVTLLNSMTLPPYNPIHVNTNGLGSTLFARRYLGNRENLLPGRNGQSED